MINIEFWHKLTEIEKGIILINYRLNIELENSKWGQILNKYSHLKPSQVYKTIFNNVFKFSDFDEQSILENLENLRSALEGGEYDGLLKKIKKRA